VTPLELVQRKDHSGTAPHDVEAELYVLGAMLLSARAINDVVQVISAGDFYRESNGMIFRAALALYAASQPVEPVTLANKLDELGELEAVGGKAKIHEITASVPAASNAGHYAHIVRELAILRRLITTGHEIVRLGEERGAPTNELVSNAEQMLFEVSESRTNGGLVHFREPLVDAFERIGRLYETGADVTGLRSHFKDLDRLTSGFQPGNLIILAARPSMGKSALALGIVANVVLRGDVCAGLFSLEMSREEIAARMMCSEARVDSQDIRTGQLKPDDWPRLTEACARLEKAPLYVDDTPALSLFELRSRTQTLKRRDPNLGLIVVDYIQLMTMGTSVESRLQEVSAVSRGLKALAKDLDIPILALSQLSRAVESRTDKRPVLSDLRESGGLEQDADLVMFIYRDEYYNRESDQVGLAEVSLAKHRNGPTGTFNLNFTSRFAKFSTYH
jgi:replicative DNA helicase